jgi:protocatechuate 3,4-dioxygenase beta subunit
MKLSFIGIKEERSMAKIKSDTEVTLKLTPAVEEGPYYKTGSPERKNIVEPGTAGEKLIVEGRVLDAKGNRVAHAWLDFWHADGQGNYDNEGFNLRGHQFTDKDGRYRLETVRPYQYLFRAPHVHVKVRVKENSPVLTVQLYLPGEKRNETDPLFEKRTVMKVTDTPEGRKATFDFVVETG